MIKKLFSIFLLFNIFVVFANSAPILSNFRVLDSEKSRVYFDSNEAITGAVVSGFIISEKSITGLHIETGQITGHYFTVNSAFDFWSNNTIRYEGGSDLKNSNGQELNEFTLEYIQNTIQEPSSTGNVIYVDSEATGSNDGSSEQNAFRTIEQGIDAISGPGDIVYVKARATTYSSGNYVNNLNYGSASNPIKIIGYKDTPGDITSNYYTYQWGSKAPELNPLEMPLIDGNNTTTVGLSLENSSYIIIRNIQVQKTLYGLRAQNGSSHAIIDNCNTKDQYGSGTQEGAGIFFSAPKTGASSYLQPSYYRATNSFAINAGMIGINVWGSSSLVKNSSSYCDRSGEGGRVGSDYYISVRGSNSIVTDCIAESIDENVNGSNHAIGVKSATIGFGDGDEGSVSQYNLFQRLYVRTGGNEYLQARNNGANYNVFKDSELVGINGKGVGISNQTGCRYNIFERIKGHGLEQAMTFKGGTESGSNPIHNITQGNIIRNSVFYDCKYIMINFVSLNIQNTFRDNHIYNCTFSNITRAFSKGLSTSSTYMQFDNNRIQNCLFNDIIEEDNGNNFPKLAQMWSISNSNFFQTFAVPSWVTESSTLDPKLDGNFKISPATPSEIYDGGINIPGSSEDYERKYRVNNKFSIGAYDNEEQITGSVNPSEVSICQGESTVLVASGGDSYSWNTGETTDSITVNPSTTTTYTVTVSSGGETGVHDVVVTVDELPSVDAGEDQVICEGESVTLTATGIGDFLWSTGETTSSITVNPNTTTTYSVTASNACSTDATDEVVVTVNPALNLNAGSDVAICDGESVTLTATGTGPFSWNTGETTASITVSPTSTTIYTVVSDNGTCSETDEVEVEVNTAAAVTLEADQTICEGQSITLTALGNGNFLWSTGETGTSITVSPNSTTTYSVTASNSCSSVDTDELVVTVNPSTNLDAGNDISICQGESVTLTATGTGPFSWSTGESTASITVNPSSTTTYTVVSDNGTCSESDEVEVSVNTPPSVNAGADKSICDGESVTLTATGHGDFLWSTGEITPSITVNPNVSSTYSVTATSPGCQSTAVDYVDVIVGESPNLATTNDLTVQRGQSVTLEATGNGTFVWNTGATTPSIIVSPNVTTSYTVTLTTEGGCSDKKTIVVSVVEATDGGSIIAYAGEDTSICKGDEIVLTASGGESFLWNTGETTRSIKVAPNESTIYSVQVSQEDYSDTAYVKVTVDGSCSKNSKEMVVYPIPTQGLLNIDLLGYENNILVRVYDANGNMVIHHNLRNENKIGKLTHNLDLAHLAKGIYYVSISNKGDTSTKKIVLL